MRQELRRRTDCKRNTGPLGGEGIKAAFDTDTTNDNFELLADYKANRKSFEKQEDSPYAHLPYIKKALDFLNISYLEIPNIEADDIIASIASDFCKNHKLNNSYIFSSDTDFYQLLSNHIFIVKLKSGDEHEVIDSEYINKKLGINPSQYIEFKSLIGDYADNIKGIKGAGPITAKKIIYKEINFDYDAHKEILDMNKKLISLNCNCEKQWELKNFSYNKNILSISNKEIFENCGFL